MPKRKLVRDVRFTRGFVALGPFRGSRWVLASPDSPKHLVSVGGTILVTQDGAPHPPCRGSGGRRHRRPDRPPRTRQEVSSAT